MSLKQPLKTRIDLSQIVDGELDYDGFSKVLYNDKFFTGYLVLDKHTDGSVAFEKEYKNGRHLGWDNEYNINGILISESLNVGENDIEFYEYDDNGNQIEGGKLVGETEYQELVSKYKLLD
ncbi:hypothetical protein [Flavobacterium daejeonense]|uniref:hypothetical protein n=1 Tax=Flavobacterium daejeonense TaxID=350893 RepID=UPI000478E586|nr:hypothetical protein [Flavobacterium daejeonense]